MFRSSRAVVDGKMLPYTRTGGMPLAPPLVPGMANLKLQYDALQIVGLIDGASISLWSDTSGQDNHASPNLPYGAAPIYKLIDNLPCVRCNGTDSLLMSTTNTFSASYTTNATIAIAYRTRAEFTSTSRLFGHQTVSGDYAKFIARTAYGTSDYTEAASTRAGLADSSAVALDSTPTDTLVLAIGVWNGSQVKYYFDGVLQATTSISGTVQGGTTNTKPWCIGGLVDGGTLQFQTQADVHEILVYDTAADGTLASEINTYMQGKWA